MASLSLFLSLSLFADAYCFMFLFVRSLSLLFPSISFEFLMSVSTFLAGFVFLFKVFSLTLIFSRPLPPFFSPYCLPVLHLLLVSVPTPLRSPPDSPGAWGGGAESPTPNPTPPASPQNSWEKGLSLSPQLLVGAPSELLLLEIGS